MFRIVFTAVVLIVFLSACGNSETSDDDEVVVETGPGYIQMDGLTVPVVVARALDHYVSVDLRFELNDSNQIAAFEELMPYIRDSILREVHRVVPEREDGIASIDILWLKARAGVIANEVLQDEVVVRVMVTGIFRVVA